MKMTVYMVRHAESPYDEGNERTRGLTAKGKADIEIVTKLLSDEGIDIFKLSSTEVYEKEKINGLYQVDKK